MLILREHLYCMLRLFAKSFNHYWRVWLANAERARCPYITKGLSLNLSFKNNWFFLIYNGTWAYSLAVLKIKPYLSFNMVLCFFRNWAGIDANAVMDSKLIQHDWDGFQGRQALLFYVQVGWAHHISNI